MQTPKDEGFLGGLWFRASLRLRSNSFCLFLMWVLRINSLCFFIPCGFYTSVPLKPYLKH